MVGRELLSICRVGVGGRFLSCIALSSSLDIIKGKAFMELAFTNCIRSWNYEPRNHMNKRYFEWQFSLNPGLSRGLESKTGTRFLISNEL